MSATYVVAICQVQWMQNKQTSKQVSTEVLDGGECTAHLLAAPLPPKKYISVLFEVDAPSSPFSFMLS